MKKITLSTLVLMLSACGGGGADGPAASNTPPPAPAPTPTPALAAAEVALFSGKTYYQQVCASCHGADPTANIMRIRANGANNPAAITNAFNRFAGMNFLIGKYSAAELSAIASYLAEPSAPPGGLFVGYYQEDPASNPEDPEPGALYLALPEGDSNFTGKLYFSYVGCQSSNVGAISGTKSGATLNGNWSGTVDGTNQSGTYAGTFDAANNVYSGNYTVAGNKQSISVPGCINYIIAPNGAWNLFSVEQNSSATFTPTINGNTLIWSSPAGYTKALVSVLDTSTAVTVNGSNAVKTQVQVAAPLTNFDLSQLGLASGKQYLASVSAFDANRARVGAGSKLFTAP